MRASFFSESETERIFAERVGPHPRWLGSSSATVIVSVSRELRRIASAAATSPARSRRLSLARVGRT
jgi:hypothetical protein